MAAFNLFRRDPAAPRVSIRQRLRNTAARIMPRMSRAHKKGGGGTNTARPVVVAGTPAVAAAGVLPAAAGAENTDAELLRLYQSHCLIGQVPLADDDATIDAHCLALADIEFTIHGIPAHTLAGLAVKAQLATVYATPADPNQPTLDDVVVSLLGDILRLAGSVPR